MDWTSVSLIAIGGARNLFRFNPFRLEAE